MKTQGSGNLPVTACIWFPAIRHRVDDGTTDGFFSLQLETWEEPVASQRDMKEEVNLVLTLVQQWSMLSLNQRVWALKELASTTTVHSYHSGSIFIQLNKKRLIWFQANRKPEKSTSIQFIFWSASSFDCLGQKSKLPRGGRACQVRKWHKKSWPKVPDGFWQFELLHLGTISCIVPCIECTWIETHGKRHEYLFSKTLK